MRADDASAVSLWSGLRWDGGSDDRRAPKMSETNVANGAPTWATGVPCSTANSEVKEDRSPQRWLE